MDAEALRQQLCGASAGLRENVTASSVARTVRNTTLFFMLSFPTLENFCFFCPRPPGFPPGLEKGYRASFAVARFYTVSTLG